MRRPRREEMAAKLYKYLVRKRKVITYTKAAKVVGLAFPSKRRALDKVLDNISTACGLINRPMLSALVVREKEGDPGSGFFWLARELKLLHGKRPKDEEDFWRAEKKRVIAYPWDSN